MTSYASNTPCRAYSVYKIERAKGSAIWSYYTLPQPTSSTATCNICKVNVPRGGTKTSSYNTTNLIKHLQKFHVREHAEFVEQNKKKGGGMTQLTLKEMKERGDKFPMNSVQATKITERILNFLVMDGQPLSVVGDKGFRLLISHLEPRYDMVSRKYLSETGLRELHGKVSKHILERIEDVKALSFTTDIWSSDVSPVSLLSLTAHWLDESFVPHSAMLNAKNFSSFIIYYKLQVGTTSNFLFCFDQAREAIVLFRCFCNGCLIPICTKLYEELIAIYFESLPTKLVKLLFSQFQLLYYFIIYFVLHCILNP